MINIGETSGKLILPLLKAEGEFVTANSPSVYSGGNYFDANVSVSVEV
jgi:hypothetical protein